MSVIPNSILKLSNAELRQELLKIGITPAPLTPTTRKLYQKKLLEKIKLDKENKDINSVSITNELENISNTSVPNNHLNASSEKSFKSVEKGKSPTIINNHSVCKKDDCHYAVLIPSDKDRMLPSVFDNKADAWKLLEKHRNARFKQFSSLSEACQFLDHEMSSMKDLNPASTASEKLNDFPSPKQTELTSLMHVIESNDIEKFNEIVWENPRYLISSADGPVPLKPSTRYNALHVAVRSNRLLMVKAILSTLEDKTFHMLMYGDKTVYDRRNHVVDLYLNTPERGCFDTPLHIASKLGFTDIVAELISHPLCDKKARNKFGDDPGKVACSRAENTLKRDEILFLLNDHYYLPLLRCSDNSLPPKVGHPWSNSFTGPPIQNQSEPCHNPIEPERVVTAIVGPMTKDKAFSLRHRWSTPNRKAEQGRRAVSIRLSDAERGDERVGRELAKNEGLQWLEYWDFLKDYADFSTEEGLLKLEDYFRHRISLNSSSASLPPHDDSINDLSLQLALLGLDSKNTEQLSSKSFEEANILPNRPSSTPVKSPAHLNLYNTQIRLMKRALIYRRKASGKRDASLPLISSEPLSSSSCERLDVGVLSYMGDATTPVNATAPHRNELYISGCQPSKLDHDVILAVSAVNPQKFPHVSNWLKSILSHPEKVRAQWKTPRKCDIDSLSRRSFASPIGNSFNSSPRTAIPRIALSFVDD